jgi:hypothetical protein
MANLLNHNKDFIKLLPDMSEYYDFFLNIDEIRSYADLSGYSLSDKCLISYIDAEDNTCIEGNYLIGKKSYVYESAITTEYSLNNIGYVGMDNGLITFKRDRISNEEFFKLFTESKYDIHSEDTTLHLHQVSGRTEQYEYPVTVEKGRIKLNGGFYQGFFKTEKEKYQILPSKLCDGNEWNMEFNLMKKGFYPESEETLNDKYPENKGIFFYIGTRAENKWYILYNEESASTSGCNNFLIDGYSAYDSYSRNDKNPYYAELENYFIDDIPDLYSIDNYMLEGNGNTIYKKIYVDDYTEHKNNTYEDYFGDGYSFENEQEEELEKESSKNQAQLYKDENNGKYYYISAITTENVCFSGSQYIDESFTPYQDYKNCECRYFSNIEKCHKEDSGNTPCSSCCDMSLETYLYDVYNYSPFISAPSKKRCKKCEDETDDEYENISADCCSNLSNNYLSEDEYVKQDITLEDFDYDTENGLKLNLTGYYEITTDNGFLIYDRTCEGYTTDTWKQGDFLTLYGRKKEYKGNLFIYMNRTCTGYTVENLDSFISDKEKNYDYEADLYRNAFALQIRDNGSIGYKYLVKDCETTSSDTQHYKILSGYSLPNIIKEDKWYTINVRFIPMNGVMKLYFYVNGKLKYITSELPIFNFKELNEIYEKQEGVPYNISLGGGSQGLCDVIMPKYMKNYNIVLPIEKNFGGSFIGYLRRFRFSNCKLNYNEINNNYLYDMVSVE